jgi:hypothetical protein
MGKWKMRFGGTSGQMFWVTGVSTTTIRPWLVDGGRPSIPVGALQLPAA